MLSEFVCWQLFITFILVQKDRIVLRIILVSGFCFAITILPIAILKDGTHLRAMFFCIILLMQSMIVFFNEKIIKLSALWMGTGKLLLGF